MLPKSWDSLVLGISELCSEIQAHLNSEQTLRPVPILVLAKKQKIGPVGVTQAHKVELG